MTSVCVVKSASITTLSSWSVIRCTFQVNFDTVKAVYYPSCIRISEVEDDPRKGKHWQRAYRIERTICGIYRERIKNPGICLHMKASFSKVEEGNILESHWNVIVVENHIESFVIIESSAGDVRDWKVGNYAGIFPK